MSVSAGIPSIQVPDIGLTLEWYGALGFEEVGRHEDDGIVNFGMLRLGKAVFALSLGGHQGEHDASLWFHTSRVDDLYRAFRARSAVFAEDIYDPFYGGRQFSVKDLNGYTLVFYDPQFEVA